MLSIREGLTLQRFFNIVFLGKKTRKIRLIIFFASLFLPITMYTLSYAV